MNNLVRYQPMMSACREINNKRGNLRRANLGINVIAEDQPAFILFSPQVVMNDDV